jgi:hypothetical protein
VTDDLTGSRCPHHELPFGVGGSFEGRCGLVEGAHQLRDACKLLVSVGRAATSDEAEHLATRSVNAKRPWRPIEAHAIEVSKQGVHSRGPRARGATDGLAYTLYLGQTTGDPPRDRTFVLATQAATVTPQVT